MEGVVLVFPAEGLEAWRKKTLDLHAAERLGLEIRIVPGGSRRQDSVSHGLNALPGICEVVIVHDAARPFFTPILTAALLEAIDHGSVAAIPGLVPSDTVKEVGSGVVSRTLDRDSLVLVQTPQAFRRKELQDAHDRNPEQTVTDDAAMIEALGLDVVVVPGEAANRKLTHPEDLLMLKAEDPPPTRTPCTGLGYDVHRFGGDRPLVLGGVPIPGDHRVFAHSDGDVLLHALTDAILGCLGAGDIGTHFPDSDPALAGMSSAVFLDRVMVMARRAGLVLTHADCTVVTQVPKIAPHAETIRANVANLLGLPRTRVNIKATTEEGLGFTGAKQGIKALVVVTGTAPVIAPGTSLQPLPEGDTESCSFTTP